MKIEKRKIGFIVISIIFSISFSAYLIYEQKGTFNKVDIISLLIAIILLALMSIFIIKKLQK